VKVNIAVLPAADAIGMLHVLLPVLAGAPGQAADVHELVVCPMPLWFFQVTVVPTAMLSDSGLKQNSNPPPAQDPETIVMVAVVAVAARADVSVALVNGVRVASTTPAAATPVIATIARMRILREFPRVRAMSCSLRMAEASWQRAALPCRGADLD
jgi:hypothetical protein